MKRTFLLKNQTEKLKTAVSYFIKKRAAVSLAILMLSLIAIPVGNVNAESSINEGTADDVIQISTFYGDLNSDSSVDSLDFALMKSLLLDNTSTIKKVSDVNGDNAFNALDLSIMKQFLLMSISRFPVADTFVDTETGSVINVEQNNTFEISLEENGTTGYQWFHNLSDISALNLISEENLHYTSRELVGAPIQKIWSFEALKPGTYTLTFEYKRSWEEGVEPIKTVQCTINISSANTINVKVNEPFKISMQEGGIAGFTSSYKISDKSVLLLSEEVNNPNPQIPDWLYSRIYTFTAIKSGQYEIVFTQRPLSSQIVYTVNVK
jgi:inhibitor of cysteine peptidase